MARREVKRRTALKGSAHIGSTPSMRYESDGVPGLVPREDWRMHIT